MDKAAFLDFAVEVIKRITGKPGFKVLPPALAGTIKGPACIARGSTAEGVERTFGWMDPPAPPCARLPARHRRLEEHDLRREGLVYCSGASIREAVPNKGLSAWRPVVSQLGCQI